MTQYVIKNSTLIATHKDNVQFPSNSYVDDAIIYKSSDTYKLNRVFTEEEMVIIEKKILGKTFMSKYDLYRYMLVPNNISYATFKQAIAQDEEAQAAFELCNNVYRGHEAVDKISALLGVSSDDVDTIFKKYGKYEG